MVFSNKRILLSLLLFLLPAAFAQTPKVEIEPITAALRARDYDKAVQLSQAELKQFPNNAQLWTLQGIAFGNKGDNKNALAAFQEALKISPDYIAALAGAAQIQYQAGDRKAIPLLNHMLQLRPGDPTSHAMLAVLEYRAGNCETAVGHFQKAGELLDSQLDAQHAYGTCLLKLQKTDDAIKVFQKTVSLNPNDPRERQVLASVYVMAKKPQEAITILEPLLQDKNVTPETLELASSAYEDAGDTPRAVSTLQQALLLDPKNINYYLDFASLCLAHQSFQVGINVISDGMKVQPQAAQLYLARGVLYVQLADYENAESDFERAHELDPNQSLSTAAQGLAAVQQNDLGRALAGVQQKLARKPNDAYLLYLQADFLTQKGIDPGTPEFQTAMRSAKKAVALQPSLAAARTVLAKLYMQAGQYQNAVVECQKALQADPKDQTTVYRLIQALRKTGNKEEIPGLLKRLAELREAATKDERERNRYKLVEAETQSSEGSAQ
jgi:tetratricopeptide (TPR) repeat protein